MPFRDKLLSLPVVVLDSLKRVLKTTGEHSGYKARYHTHHNKVSEEMAQKKNWQYNLLQTFDNNTRNCLKMHHMQTHAGIKSI